MLFLKAFVVGIGFMLGVEIALGLCNAIIAVLRGIKK
jgi:hypothetical protein